MKMKILFYTFLFSFCTIQSKAQELDANNRLTVALNDGTKVNLIGKAMPIGSEMVSNDFYYLPTNLRLAKKADGTPEFLFVKYTTEKDATAGGVQGAIIHFLMEWGLNVDQRKEAEQKLKELLGGGKAPTEGSLFSKQPLKRDKGTTSNARILGPVDLMSNESSFKIYSASLSDAKIMQSGRAPTLEGAKAIVAAKMDKYAAQLLAATLDKTKSIADLSLEMQFSYQAKIPAVKGSVVIDWTKVKGSFESLFASKKYGHYRDGLYESHTITYNEMQAAYSYCMEHKAITVNIDLGGRTQAEQEAANKISELFMQTFANFIADKSFEDKGDKDDAPQEDPSVATSAQKLKEQAAWAHNYKINVTKIKQHFSSGLQTITLNQRFNSTFNAPLSGNLLAWYDQVKNNTKCIYSVNLNDPFFDHRIINFILDLDGKEMFETEANYVTVNVRKKRDKGNSFADRIVIDKKYLTEKGSNSTVMYARGEDTNPDVFEYQMQWSLRGGNIFPPVPLWEKGEWAGITLAPPVKPRLIEFEANLEQLKEMGISRATLQVRYKKFNEEIEENLHVSPAQGQALVNKNIFTDKDTKGYVYRLVLNHTTEGKLALPWSAKTADNYVFATIPPDLKDKSSKIFQEAKKIGNIIKSADGKVPNAETIIDTFKEIFDIVKPKKN